MKILNKTQYHLETLFETAVDGFDHSGLTIEVKYCPDGSGRCISGTYYRQTPRYPDGKLIRLRINPRNKYPLRVAFKTSDYFTRMDKKGREVTYQRLRYERFAGPERLALAIFLHEFSHYLDHMEGKNGRYKQTKADKFSIERMKSRGIVK
jgi:hypothetical protein